MAIVSSKLKPNCIWRYSRVMSRRWPMRSARWYRWSSWRPVKKWDRRP